MALYLIGWFKWLVKVVHHIQINHALQVQGLIATGVQAYLLLANQLHILLGFILEKVQYLFDF